MSAARVMLRMAWHRSVMIIITLQTVLLRRAGSLLARIGITLMRPPALP